jgi:hypothetical protein
MDLGTRSWTRRPGRLALVHRVGAGVLGLVLCGFGVLGLVNRLAWFDTQGQPIAGLTTNGLLSMVSLVVGAVLITAAVRGGRTASSVTVTVGVLFLLSGVANVLVLNGPFNILAFRMSNVVFSLLAGLVLLSLGACGRFTGRLPPDNPYRRERHPGEGRYGADLEEQPGEGEGEGYTDRLPTAYRNPADIADVAGLAEAERAVARGGATREQADGVTWAARTRRGEDRILGWRQRRRERGSK